MGESLQKIRRALSHEQIMEADRIGHSIFEGAYGRPTDTTYTIDDIPSYKASDRDDGIRVERIANGYRVHVTISDVAAYVPLGNTLSEAAWQRGFTTYRPQNTDHMFDEDLVYRMSLEDNKPRLGMRVSVELDENFQPIHTSLCSTNVTPIAHSYDDAAEKMQSDDQFKLMADVAKGLRQNYFSEEEWADITDVPNDELTEGRPTINQNLSEQQIAATKLVEVYMLLANSAVASLFAKSDLPYAYRNFSDERPAKDGHPQRAYYSTEWQGHTELEKIGLKKPYCHFTSPIRRGPDYFNGRMAHYAIANLDRLKTRCQQNFKLNTSQLETLEHVFWQHADAYLEYLGAEPGKSSLNIHTFLSDALEASGVAHDEISQELLDKVVHSALGPGALPIPFSKAELAKKLEHINMLCDIEADRLEEFDIQHALKMAYKRDVLSTLDDTSCAVMEDDQFSARLNDAAQTGYLPPALMTEALKRIQSISALPRETTLERDYALANGKKLRMNQVEDALSILIDAPYAYDPKWVELKKAMCSAIHDKPGIVRTVFDHAFTEYKDHGKTRPPRSGSYAQSRYSPIPVDSDSEHEQTIAASICVIEKEGQMLSSPTYSIGHDKRSSDSHAMISLLENYAFSQLQPIDQSMIPNLLYAELDSDTRTKRNVVEGMLTPTKTALSDTIFTQANDGRWFARIRAEGGALNNPIPTAAKADTKEAAEDRALSRLLRNPIFRRAFAYKASPELHAQVNPLNLLTERALEHSHIFDPDTDVQAFPATIGFSKGYKATVTLMHPDASVTSYTPWEVEPNKDRAINRACMQAMHALGWVNREELDQAPASWIERAASQPKIETIR